jgi:hypothetical protein
MKNIKDMSDEELENVKHGEEVVFRHKTFIDYYNHNEEHCNGIVRWDNVLEGFVCNKCALYTGVK